ncbi:MAG TPA: DNA primase, partial [Ruminococcus sp.]|nr:DNA primase [Ruminococcus sp.]
MRFSDEFLTELRSRVDIEELVGRYTEIRHRGSRTPVALCPFHTEKTPSFVIYRENQSYYCFGCGAGGDAITFVKNIERLDYVEAVRYLCERVGMNMPMDPVDDQYNRLRRRCFEANREAAKFFYAKLLSEEGEAARAYLQKRRLTDETVKHFGLGYAPDRWDSLLKYLRGKGYRDDELISFDLARRTSKGGTIDAFRNRLMFPIIDLRGDVIGFGGRVLGDGTPKYLNSPDTPVFNKSRNLFALNLAKKSKSGYIILSEGNIDVVSLHQAGFDSAVASLGT